MTLLVRPHVSDARGVVLDVTPESAGWDYVGFRVVKLQAGQSHDGLDAGRETCLVILSGTVSVAADEEHFEALGSRASVFDGLPTSVYVPASLAYAIHAATDAERCCCGTEFCTDAAL